MIRKLPCMLLKRGSNFFAVAIKAKEICRVFDAIEVEVDEWIGAVPEQRFYKRKARRRWVVAAGASEELGFKQAFAEFRFGVGVDDDAAADSHATLVAVEGKRA